jgi:hypothetical protein
MDVNDDGYSHTVAAGPGAAGDLLSLARWDGVIRAGIFARQLQRFANELLGLFQPPPFQ